MVEYIIIYHIHMKIEAQQIWNILYYNTLASSGVVKMQKHFFVLIKI